MKCEEANTHPASSIVMDVAIVESHAAANDIKTPALPNGEGNVMETSSNGVMEECAGKVQKASTHAPTLHERDERSERSERFHPTG